MVPALALALFHAALLVWAFVRLPPLHPVQLWALPWAATTGLFALHLLPYRSLGVGTALLIAGATTSFCLGVWLASRAANGIARPHLSEKLFPRRITYETVALAAALSLVALGVLLAAFLIEVAQAHGARATLVTTQEVRGALQEGLANTTIKYVYFTLAAAGLCALAAAMAQTSVARRGWLSAAAVAAFSAYFSTGRSNIVLALLVGLVVFVVAYGPRPSPKVQAMVLAGAALLVLGIFIAGGALIGKTLENNPLGQVRSPFTQHGVLRPLALPYQYATAPIPALDRQLAVAEPLGETHGCAVLTVACQVGDTAGLPLEAEPRIRPFTGGPLPWNTYTALDMPLLDGGPVFVLVFFLLCGAITGLVHERARAGGTLALLAYGLLSSALVYSSTQNNFLAPHLIGALLLVVLSLVAAIYLRGLERPVPRLVRRPR